MCTLEAGALTSSVHHGSLVTPGRYTPLRGTTRGYTCSSTYMLLLLHMVVHVVALVVVHMVIEMVVTMLVHVVVYMVVNIVVTMWVHVVELVVVQMVLTLKHLGQHMVIGGITGCIIVHNWRFFSSSSVYQLFISHL